MEKFCQSCGMPMEEDKLYGTNADGSKNPDYCEYCYKGGEFTSDVTLEEMIDICTPFVVESGAMAESQARAMLSEVLPKLKRWAK